jgi:hypothetical protein
MHLASAVLIKKSSVSNLEEAREWHKQVLEFQTELDHPIKFLAY